jgi:hypothetical protein
MGGVRRAVLAGERDWLLARIGEKRDLTLRAIQAELADRGVKVSYDAVWRFYLREGFTFKKKPVRHRAGPPGRGAQARSLETPSRTYGTGPAKLRKKKPREEVRPAAVCAEWSTTSI